MSLDPAQILAELIAIDSVNPMGREVDCSYPYESNLTDYLQLFFEHLALPWHRQTVEPRRDNIFAWIDGGPRRLLLEVHQDTVPVEGMTIAPFTPTIDSGRIYGRGACDVKGGMAAMLAAVARLAETRPDGMPTIVLACCMNEEHGFTGSRALASCWQSLADQPWSHRPDAAIVAEPTELDVVVAHKGINRWRCHTHGRAAHSSRPQLGENAIYKMAQVLGAIEAFDNSLANTNNTHQLCGRSTVAATTIHGGSGVNIVPDHCSIEIDLRSAPGDDPFAVRLALIDAIGQHDPTATHDDTYITSAGLNDHNNTDLAAAIASEVERSGRSCQTIGVPYATDAGEFAAAGVPSVVFGPGSIDQAHTADEWLDLEQLQQAAELYYQFAAGAVSYC